VLIIDSLLKHHHYNPDHIAFSDGDRALNYRSFFTHAEHISHVLLHHGVSAGDRVAVLLPRGIDAACCIYGILFTGACYVPLDVHNPSSRLRYIMDDVQPRCAIGRGDKPEWCGNNVEWININYPECFEDEPQSDRNVIYHSSPEDIAAILYTSGSTGHPKGVSISHRAIDAFVAWSTSTFSINHDDRIASLAPFHFDLSLFDLFTSIHCGAHTCFVPQSLTLAPTKLVTWLEEKAITSWYTVPSILAFLSMRGGLAADRLPSMKRILFAGEVFPLPSLSKLTEALPNIDFYNLFGPTETNVCTYWQVDRERLSTLSSLPIGAAACESKLKVDESGELLVRGPCIMSGYWKNSDVEHTDHQWYHTGDRVSYNDRGELLYHGRMDRMLKSSGYRIEPAEIESVINRFAQIENSVVIGESDPISGNRLVAVVVGNDVDINSMRTHLKQNLAAYMQPYRFVQLSAMPLLSNGKVDYQAVKGLI